MFSTKPWDVYVEELLPIGYGHPLWSPEPISTGSREVLVGDVGWLKEGEFRALFNTTRDEDDAIHQELGVPRDFTVFSPSTALILRSDKITAPMVFSRSISASEAQAEASIDPRPGVAEDAMAKRHIVNYMRSNFDSWLEFANASNSAGGLDRRDLRPSDLLFVCGTLKTTQWAVAAFHGSEFRNKQGQIGSGRVQGPHGLETRTGVEGFSGIQVHIGDTPLPDEWCKAGPARRPTAELESHANQCLFIHYYKMKRRFLLSVEPMLAAAGPDRLPPGPQDPGPDAKVPCQGAGASACDDHRKSHEGAEAYDPVSDLLDYILLASTADIAIASDLDLITLFRRVPSRSSP
uniref:Superoxide dismutase (EC) n=1 Tax=Ganoderma boninense TaxID=34458 RepID=A0A5K1JZ44_9APHY|nr:Superoxide dismutase (EC [Ganoderma boninense]